MRLLSVLAAVLVSGFTSAFAGPGTANDFGGRRVLLIGIDGCRADAIRKLTEAGRAPNLKSLIATGAVTWNAFAGGLQEGESQQETSSGPGWTTILTGVWRDRHGVADNRFRFHRIAQWPHWMKRIKDHAPKAWMGSLCDWPEIHQFIVASSRTSGGPDFLNFEFLTTTKDATGKHIDYDKCDSEITERAVEQLRTADPDVLFVYFGNLDETGHGVAHKEGKFSPDNEPYCAALAQVDEKLGKVLAAMKARPKFAEENWLVLATTDHGGRDTKHGGQTPEERTIWMIANGGEVPKGAVIEKQVPQTAVAPTVFRHLGIPIGAEWGWEKEPFGLPAK
jgi:predicted AlkP superfamily pyrophosphatase or phosphodiesterase